MTTSGDTQTNMFDPHMGVVLQDEVFERLAQEEDGDTFNLLHEQRKLFLRNREIDALLDEVMHPEGNHFEALDLINEQSVNRMRLGQIAEKLWNKEDEKVRLSEMNR